MNSSNKPEASNEKPPYSYVALIAMAIEVNNLIFAGTSAARPVHAKFTEYNLILGSVFLSLSIFFVLLVAQYTFHRTHNNAVPRSTKSIRISRPTSRTTRKTKKAGKIPFDII